MRYRRGVDLLKSIHYLRLELMLRRLLEWGREDSPVGRPAATQPPKEAGQGCCRLLQD